MKAIIKGEFIILSEVPTKDVNNGICLISNQFKSVIASDKVFTDIKKGQTKYTLPENFYHKIFTLIKIDY